MKANELRIGNIIKGAITDYCFVAEINPFKVHGLLRSPAGSSSASFPLASIDPIPLTEEWLTKCGFELDVSQVELWHKDGIWMHFDGDSLSANFGHIQQLDVDIKYVHQLQNLFFALTGEELEIKQTVTP